MNAFFREIFAAFGLATAIVIIVLWMNMPRSYIKLRDPCATCSAPEECWNYGYREDRQNWFECENACGPHNSRSQPIDVRECGHVTEFTPKYIHTTIPLERIEGADAILERESEPFDRAMAESFREL